MCIYSMVIQFKFLSSNPDDEAFPAKGDIEGFGVRVSGLACNCRVRGLGVRDLQIRDGTVGRPLGYSIFSLIALIGDPIY